MAVLPMVVMLPRTIETRSFADFAVEFEVVLERLDRLGVRWGGGRRFDVYRKAFAREATLPHPRKVERSDAAEWAFSALLREAAVQAQQLVLSSEIWSTLDQEVLTKKLRLIVRGPSMPPPAKDDPARNTLAELATAALMARRGFRVSISEHDEDVLAESASHNPLAIECKRPATRDAIETNIGRLRDQLRVRCARGDRYGFAVIAADRLLGRSGGEQWAISAAHLHAAVDHELRELVFQLRAIVTDPRRPHLQLYPRDPLPRGSLRRHDLSRGSRDSSDRRNLERDVGGARRRP